MQVAISDPVSRIVERIEEKIGPRRFRVWFKDVTRLDVTDSCVRIDVPNSWVGTWIENHFAEEITDAAREVLGSEVQLGFTIDPSLAGTIRQPQLNRQAESVRQATQKPTQASATRLKAEAFQKYNEAAVIELLVKVLPELAGKIAEPLAKTEKMVIINSGNGPGGGASKLTGDITQIIAQLPPVLESLTGVKFEKLLEQVPALKNAMGKETPKAP